MAKPKKKLKEIKTTPEAFTTLILLKERYPDIFTDDVEKMRPLKMTIYMDLQKELKGVVSQDSIHRAVRIYRGQKVYLEKLIVPDAEEVNLQGECHKQIREGYAKIVEIELRKMEAEGLDCLPMESFPPERWDSFKDRPPKIKIPPPVKKVEKSKKVAKKPKPLGKVGKKVVGGKKSVKAKTSKPKLGISRKSKPKLSAGKKSVRSASVKKAAVVVHHKPKRRVIDKPSTVDVARTLHADKPKLGLRRKPKS